MSLELWPPCAVRSCLCFVPVRGMVCQWHVSALDAWRVMLEKTAWETLVSGAQPEPAGVWQTGTNRA